MPSNKYQIIQEFLPTVVVNQIVIVDTNDKDRTSSLTLRLTTGKEMAITFPTAYLKDNPHIFEEIEDGWCPQMGEEYFAINKDGFISRWIWENNLINHEVYAFGNCFPTKETAEKAKAEIREVFRTIMENYQPKNVHKWKAFGKSSLN